MFTIKNTKRLTNKVAKILLADIPQRDIDKSLIYINKTNPNSIYLTMKVKIYPTNEQIRVLWLLAENCRLLYNFALGERKSWWEKNKYLSKNMQDIKNKPTYFKQTAQVKFLKEEYPNYKYNITRTLYATLKQLDTDFRSFRALLKKGYVANPPRFKGKKYFTSIFYNREGFKIKGNKIFFNHFYPSRDSKSIELKFDLNCDITFTNEIVKQVTISQDYKSKEFYLSIIYKKEILPYHNNGIYQAFDLGVMNIVASVNSHAGKTLVVENNRVDKYWQPKIEEVQSKRDRCKKHSNRWYWYNDKLQKMKRKQAFQQKDFQHKLSKKVVEHTKANTIIIGDLNVKEMSRSKKGDWKNKKSLHRTMQSTGALGRFARFLTYKAQRVGKKVIRISEKRTTKRCCYCMEKKIRHLSERIIYCEKCGLKIDRDINGAVNIMQRFLAIFTLSQKRLVVRQQMLKDFRQLFFATHSQTSNESSFSNEVGRTRKKS
jgi:putative transposase